MIEIANMVSPFIAGVIGAALSAYVAGKVLRAEFDIYRQVTDERLMEIRADVKSIHRRIDFHYSREERR